MVVYCQFSDVIIFHGEAIMAKISMRHRQPTMMSSGDITILKVRWYSSLEGHQAIQSYISDLEQNP